MTIRSIRYVRRMLPKTYDHRTEVLSEISLVLSHYQHLEPVLEKFVFNDGTAKNLINLTGTIQVFYERKQYNIPVTLWLRESYPRTAPICYLKPTCEMVVVTSKYVNSNGEIKMPYLDEWRHTKCDLHSLIQVMMVIFSEVPPLRMRLDQEKWKQISKEFRPSLSDLKHDKASKASSGHKIHSADDFSYVTLDREDDLPFYELNETIC